MTEPTGPYPLSRLGSTYTSPLWTRRGRWGRGDRFSLYGVPSNPYSRPAQSSKPRSIVSSGQFGWLEVTANGCPSSVRERNTLSRTSVAVAGANRSSGPTRRNGAAGARNRSHVTTSTMTSPTTIDPTTHWMPSVPRNGPSGPIFDPVLTPGGRMRILPPVATPPNLSRGRRTVRILGCFPDENRSGWFAAVPEGYPLGAHREEELPGLRPDRSGRGRVKRRGDGRRIHQSSLDTASRAQ